MCIDKRELFIAMLLGAVFSGCGGPTGLDERAASGDPVPVAPKPADPSDQELLEQVKRDIQTHPLLQKLGINIHVLGVENGYVRLTVLGRPQLLQELIAAPPAPILGYMADDRFLTACLQLQEAIGKNPHCKGVFWDVQPLSVELLSDPLAILAVTKQTILVAERINSAYFLARTASLQHFAGDSEAAGDTFRECERFLKSIESTNTFTLRAIVGARWTLGDYEAAEKTLQEMLDGIRTIDEASERSLALQWAAGSQAGMVQFDRAFETVRSIEEPSSRIAALAAIAWCQSSAGQRSAALTTLEKVSHEISALKHAPDKAWHLARVAMLQADIEALKDARATLQVAKALFDKMEEDANAIGQISLLCHIGGAEAKLGNRPAALSYIERAQQLVSQVPDDGGKARASAILVRALWAAGQKEPAVELANEIRNLPWRVEAYLGMAHDILDSRGAIVIKPRNSTAAP